MILPGCKLAAPGWVCTRAGGHEGPCAAVEINDPRQGPTLKWSEDGLLIVDETHPRGGWRIDWDVIDGIRKRFRPAV